LLPRKQQNLLKVVDALASGENVANNITPTVDLTGNDDDPSDLVIKILEEASMQDAKPHNNSEELSMLNAGSDQRVRCGIYKQ
jgi:hypothetical protein